MQGMVVAPQPLAVEEGILVLRQGGNAIDAAVTAAFVQGVIDPLSCGIGGFGVMLVHTAQGEDLFLDFNATAGSRATPDMWLDEIEAPAVADAGYFLRGQVNEIGYQSVGVPGTVLGLYQAWERYGTLSWEEVLRPAIRQARTGYAIPAEPAHSWRKPGFGGRANAADAGCFVNSCRGGAKCLLLPSLPAWCGSATAKEETAVEYEGNKSASGCGCS